MAMKVSQIGAQQWSEVHNFEGIEFILTQRGFSASGRGATFEFGPVRLPSVEDLTQYFSGGKNYGAFEDLLRDYDKIFNFLSVLTNFMPGNSSLTIYGEEPDRINTSYLPPSKSGGHGSLTMAQEQGYLKPKMPLTNIGQNIHALKFPERTHDLADNWKIKKDLWEFDIGGIEASYNAFPLVEKMKQERANVEQLQALAMKKAHGDLHIDRAYDLYAATALSHLKHPNISPQERTLLNYLGR